MGRLPSLCPPAKLGVLLQGPGTDVGGKQQRMTLLEHEIIRSLVGEKLGAMTQDEVVQLQHGPLGSSIIPRSVRGKTESEGLGEVLQPLKSPLHRADDAVGVAGGEGRFPAVHPS